MTSAGLSIAHVLAFLVLAAVAGAASLRMAEARRPHASAMWGVALLSVVLAFLTAFALIGLPSGLEGDLQ